MASKAEVQQVLPHVWVLDDAIPQPFLEHVDRAFEGGNHAARTMEKYNGRSITSRSIEFQRDRHSEPFFEMIEDCWGLKTEESCCSFMVSDVCAEGQEAHVDHINLDDLVSKKLDFLDLSLQSSQAGSACRVVPTVTIVAYFNSVGGIRFPHAPDQTGTIAAKRGRIVMFENYQDCHRPLHNPLAAHYGIYFENQPKRILVMGILANKTPTFSRSGRQQALTRSLIYCPGTESDPLRHENPSYDHYYSPEELRERNAAMRDAEAREERMRQAMGAKPDKIVKIVSNNPDKIVSLEVTFKEKKEETLAVVVGRNIAGEEICNVTGDSCKSIMWLRKEIKMQADPEDKFNLVLAKQAGEVLGGGRGDSLDICAAFPEEFEAAEVQMEEEEDKNLATAATGQGCCRIS